MDSEEPVTLFPVPTKLVERLIELYSTVYKTDINEYKKNTEDCDWCKRYFKKYYFNCFKCHKPFMNCLDCFNVARFQCTHTNCREFVCRNCNESNHHASN